MSFCVILPDKFISGIILVILGDHLGQKVNLKIILTYMLQIGARLIHCLGVILTK